MTSPAESVQLNIRNTNADTVVSASRVGPWPTIQAMKSSSPFAIDGLPAFDRLPLRRMRRDGGPGPTLRKYGVVMVAAAGIVPALNGAER